MGQAAMICMASGVTARRILPEASGGTAWVLTYGEDQGVGLHGEWSPAVSFLP